MFGEFGARVGSEAGAGAGREAGLVLARQLVVTASKEEGGRAGERAGEEAARRELEDDEGGAGRGTDLAISPSSASLNLREQFSQLGGRAGAAAGRATAAELLAGLELSQVEGEARRAAVVAAEKYALKAREFEKLAGKVGEEAGLGAGEESGELEVRIRIHYLFFKNVLRVGRRARKQDRLPGRRQAGRRGRGQGRSWAARKEAGWGRRLGQRLAGSLVGGSGGRRD